jgi:MerR family transcriptional regulator/heat shock protein HspR
MGTLLFPPMKVWNLMPRKRHGQMEAIDDPNLPKYTIAVAADISGVPQQQLRRMEDGGLVTPRRSQGNSRRYSDNDLRQIAAASHLAENGINAAGIRLVLELRAEIAALRAEVESLRQHLAALDGAGATPAKERAHTNRPRRSQRHPTGQQEAKRDTQ